MGIFFRDEGDGGFEPPRWDVGDPIGFGNDIGAPEIPSISEDDTEEVEERLKGVAIADPLKGEILKVMGDDETA